MTSLQLRFLGPARLQRDGDPVAVQSAKALALLGYLAAAGQRVPREAVVDLLWPHSAPEAGRKNLRNALWAIGRALGREAVAADEAHVALSPEAWTDVGALRGATDGDAAVRPLPTIMPADALEAIARHYRGPLLEGLDLPDAPDFELWLAAERERLAAAQLRVLGALVEARRREGDWAGMADAARRSLEVDRLHEPMHRVLIEALARAGRRAEALRAYDGLRDALDAELGVPPLPETDALAAAIREGTLAPPAPGATPGGGGPMPGAAADPERCAALPFVGRGAEVADVVRVASEAAERSEARVVVITGEAGIGKSRLWREAARALPAGARVAEARALASTQALPFVPVVDLLTRARPLAAVLEGGSALAPVWLSEIARLLPELGVRRPSLAPPLALPPAEERRRLFEALAQALLAAGGRPLAVFVDDVQWADDTTLDWLGYAVHRLRDAPLLVAVAYRDDEAPAALRALVAGWEREGIARRVPLERLDAEDAGALLASLGADAAAARRWLGLAGGNPLFLAELARMGGDAVPPQLAEVVRVRLGRLPEGARQVVQAAAVLEPGIDLAGLRRTAGRSEDETLDALDVLVGAAILEEEAAGRYGFAHPLVAAVVLQDLGGARRAVLHRRAAEALAATHAADPEGVAGRMGRHLAAAGEPERAAGYLARAGARALDQAAAGEAAALFEEALALDPTPGRRLDLARARVRLGDAAGARDAFEAAYEAFVAGDDGRGAAEAALGLAGTFLGTGRPDAVAAWARRGLDHLGPDGDPAALALGRILLGAGAQDAAEGAPAAAETHLQAAATLAREHDLPVALAQSQFELGNLRARHGDLGAARRAYGDAIRLAEAAGEVFLQALGHNNAAYHALLDGDPADARAHLDAGLALAEAHDLAPARQWLFGTAGEVALAEARWDEAEGWLRRALAEAERLDNQEQVANVRAKLGHVERGRGRLREAAVLLAAASHAAARLRSPHLQASIALDQAEVALERGEAADAVEALGRAEAVLAGRGYAALEARAAALREGRVASMER